MKLELEDIVKTLMDSSIEKNKVEEVAKELAALAERLQKEKEEDRLPRIKKKMVLLHIQDTLSYYIIQVAKDDDLSTVVTIIQKSIGDYNQSAKKKKVEIKNFADALEAIPLRIFKNNGLSLKTRVPCEIKDLPVWKV
jgi:hypothetical protein